MPAKRDASKATKATKPENDKQPVLSGRTTRAAKKRDQLDLAAEEPVVDTKKTKVADKEVHVPSKSSKETNNKRKKELAEVLDQEAKQPVTKRKRTTTAATAKEIKSYSKDVNDNEEQIAPEVDKPKRGRKKQTTVAIAITSVSVDDQGSTNLNKLTSASEQQPAKQQRARGRGKKVVKSEIDKDEELVEEQPVATTKRNRKKETASDDKEINLQPDEIKVPIKRGRGKAKKPTNDELEKEETALQEKEVSLTVQLNEKPIKKSRAVSSQKTAEEIEQQKDMPEEQLPKKRGAKKKEEEAPELSSQEPVKPTRLVRGRSKVQRIQAEKVEIELPLAKSKTRLKKASVSLDEQATAEKQQIESEIQLEKPKRSNRTAESKAEALIKNDNDNAALGRGKRGISRASRQAEEVKEDGLVIEQHEEKPVKRGMGKSKTKSTNETNELSTELVARKTKGKARKEEIEVVSKLMSETGKRSRKKTTEGQVTLEEENVNLGDEKVSKSSDLTVINERSNEIADDEEDDNKSEKELVIDLKEDLPAPPKKRGTKIKAVTQMLELEQIIKSQQTEPVIGSFQAVTDTQQPVAKRGRAKKQLKADMLIGEEETEVPVKQSKCKPAMSDDDKLFPKDKDQDNLEQPLIKSLETGLIEDKEKLAVVKPTFKRNEAENKMQIDLEPPPIDRESMRSADEPDNEKNEEEKREDSRLETDESASSHFDVDKVQSDVHTVLDDIKLQVEISTRDLKSVDSTIDDNSSASLNETGEVISAKELEEYTSDDDGLKITYNSIINANETKAASEPSISNTPSFTICSESETNARKRIKLFNTDEVLSLPSISGKLITFGRDLCGELGRLEAGNDRHLPGQLKINESENFCFICSQSQHSVCISTAGRLYTFGNNDECALGRLTNNDDDQCATPTMLNTTLSLYKFCKASVGESHTAVLTTSGSVFFWGNFRDSNGSVGLTADIRSASIKPVAVDLSLDIVSIASGGNFLLLLDSYGTVYSMGIGERGELGRFKDEESCKFHNKKFDREQRASFLEPRPIQFPKNVKIDAIWCGEYAGFARVADSGRLFAWGLNNCNQLGIARQFDQDLCVFEPREINYFNKSSLKIEKIVGGQHHTLMLDSEGRVYACGRHEYGRLGLGVITESPAQPKLIEYFKDKVVDIACGLSSSYAVTAKGELFSWGAASPELGLGEEANEENRWEPTLVKSNLMSRFKSDRVTAGSSHCLVLGQLTNEDVINKKLIRTITAQPARLGSM